MHKHIYKQSGASETTFGGGTIAIPFNNEPAEVALATAGSPLSGGAKGNLSLDLGA